jgi:hypothetical protein
VLTWAAMIGVICWLTGDVYLDAKLSTLGVNPGVVEPPADRVARYGFMVLYIGGAYLTGTVWGWFLTVLIWLVTIAALFALLSKVTFFSKDSLVSKLITKTERAVRLSVLWIVQRLHAVTPEQAQKYKKALRVVDVGNSWAFALLMPLLFSLLAFTSGAKQGEAEARSIMSAAPNCLSSKQCRHICVGRRAITGIVAFADNDKLIIKTQSSIRVIPQTHTRFIGYAIATPPQKCPMPVEPAF